MNHESKANVVCWCGTGEVRWQGFWANQRRTELPFTDREQTRETYMSGTSSAYVHVTMTTGHVSLLSCYAIKMQTSLAIQSQGRQSSVMDSSASQMCWEPRSLGSYHLVLSKSTGTTGSTPHSGAWKGGRTSMNSEKLPSCRLRGGHR